MSVLFLSSIYLEVATPILSDHITPEEEIFHFPIKSDPKLNEIMLCKSRLSRLFGTSAGILLYFSDLERTRNSPLSTTVIQHI
jgi:hypothetical protein